MTMKLKRTPWGFDSRWTRVEAVDEANPVETLFTWFEPAGEDSAVTNSSSGRRSAQ
ncbi:MAG: hypothetical protein KDA85_05010 [Planctomycetaceae bacterium]|nr:hypothetical protein [Planctomycetaceae bacterium]